jgi:hypothetical protein
LPAFEADSAALGGSSHKVYVGYGSGATCNACGDAPGSNLRGEAFRGARTKRYAFALGEAPDADAFVAEGENPCGRPFGNPSSFLLYNRVRFG